MKYLAELLIPIHYSSITSI